MLWKLEWALPWWATWLVERLYLCHLACFNLMNTKQWPHTSLHVNIHMFIFCEQNKNCHFDPMWCKLIVMVHRQSIADQTYCSHLICSESISHLLISIFFLLLRWLAEDKYYENLPEDGNGVSHFTFTVSKERTKVRCEAQNMHNIDTKTAYITVPNGNKIDTVLFLIACLLLVPNHSNYILVQFGNN